MSIDSLNTSLNSGSMSVFKSNIETSTVNQKSENLEVERQKSKESVGSVGSVELMSSKAIDNFSENSEEQMENLDDAIEKLNETANIFHRSLKFSINEDAKRTKISVINTDTKEVIREIPSEEVLDMVTRMRDYLGLIFDKEA